jgi:hypothetical protein
MDATQTVVAILSATGAGAILLAIANAIIKQVTGRAGRERIYNTTVESQRMAAIEERDAADRNDRRGRDEISRLRGLLLEQGIDPGPLIVYEATTKARTARSRIPKE